MLLLSLPLAPCRLVDEALEAAAAGAEAAGVGPATDIGAVTIGGGRADTEEVEARLLLLASTGIAEED